MWHVIKVRSKDKKKKLLIKFGLGSERTDLGDILDVKDELIISSWYITPKLIGG